MKNNNFIFLPGWGFSPQLFSTLAKELSGMAIFLELPWQNTLTLNKIVSQIAQSIPDQGTIIAWSLGGLIALKLCARFPHKYRRLILLSTTPKFTEDADWSGVSKLAAMKIISTFDKYPDQLLRRFIRWVNHPNKDITLKKHISLNSALLTKNYDKESLSYYLKLLFQTDLRYAYASIKTPILHLLGSKESIISMQPEQLTALNPNVKLGLLKNAGHALFLTHQNECLHHIECFLKGTT